MPKSIEKYTNERQEVLNKLLNILEINEKNKILTLKSLDENEEKQQQILALVEDIKKFFNYSRWTFFNNKSRECKRDYLSLTKAIMKEMNVKMKSSTMLTKIDDKIKCETFYIFDFL
jgi:hypothetical protein